MTASPEIADPLAAGAAQAARRSAEALARAQDPAGYWQAPQTLDPERTADWLLARFCVLESPPGAAELDPARQALADHRTANLDTNVRMYAALKVSGLAPDSAPLTQLRGRILERGGLDATGVAVRGTLAVLGLLPAGLAPEIPVELILAQRTLYSLPAPERAQRVPLALALTSAPAQGAAISLAELRSGATDPAAAGGAGLRLRVALSRLLGQRQTALRRCDEWMRDRSHGIPGAALARILALAALGQKNEAATLSPFREDRIGDTARVAWALAEAGAGANPRAAAWLAGREIRRRGEWSVHRPGLEPSGWACAAGNDLYPDLPGTAAVVRALAGSAPETIARASRWMTGMQVSAGGWAMFDAAAEAPAAGITGRVLEALCAAGLAATDRVVRRGVKFLEQAQGSEGNWPDAGGEILAGTCFVLRGFAAAGESDREAHILRAGEWLRSIQNADGGWGESVTAAGAYAPAPSTVTETAWAVAGLLASGDTTSSSMQKGVEYLISQQRPDAAWTDAGPGPGDAAALLALGAFLKSRMDA